MSEPTMLNLPFCGCGQPVRYMVGDNQMACNKYFRCLNREEATAALVTANTELAQLRARLSEAEAKVREFEAMLAMARETLEEYADMDNAETSINYSARKALAALTQPKAATEVTDADK